MAFVPYVTTPDFAKFKANALRAPPKIIDADHPYTAPPQKGTFIGTIKLHGTNTTLVFRNNNRENAQIQSRNIVISLEKDNVGAAKFIGGIPLKPLVDEILRIRGCDGFEELFICGEYAGTGPFFGKYSYPKS